MALLRSPPSALYSMLRLAGAVCPHVPPGLGYRLADRVGELNYRLSRRAAEAVRQNVWHILAGRGGAPPDDAQVDRIARRVFCNLVKNYYDLFRLSAANARQALDLLDIAGLEHVRTVRAVGRGMIVASAHYGNPELLMLGVAAATGVKILTVAEHLKPEEVYRYMVARRSQYGLRLIPADGPLLEVYRVLRRGEAVALALDRDTTDSGVQVSFLGAPAHLPDGYARLVARTRAPLVIGFGRRLAGERVRLDIEPPYVPPPGAPREQVYAQALEHGVQALGRAVSAWPEQWVLTTAVWKAESYAHRSRFAL